MLDGILMVRTDDRQTRTHPLGGEIFLAATSGGLIDAVGFRFRILQGGRGQFQADKEAILPDMDEPGGALRRRAATVG